MFRKLLHGYLFLLLTCFRLSSAQYQLPFVHYTADNQINPLPGVAVYDVYQDRLNFLWISIFSAGLVRYDGHRMEVYTTRDGLRSLNFTTTIEDTDGRLWVMTDGGLSVSEQPLKTYGAHRVRFIDRIGDQPLAKTSISQIAMKVLAQDTAGRIYLGTTGAGILRYSRVKPDFWSCDTITTQNSHSSRNASVYSMMVDKKGLVWISTDDGVAILKPGGHRIEYLERSIIPPVRVQTFFQTNDETLLAGCEDGSIYQWEKEAHGFRKMDHTLTSPVYDITQDRRGDLWICSDGAGVLRWRKGNSPEHITRRQGLIAESVRFVMEDREGTLWFSQVGGLSKLRANYKAFQSISADATLETGVVLPDPNVTGISTEAWTGDKPLLWMGLGKGFAALNHDGKISHFDAKKGLSSNTVYDVLVDEKKRLWVGTFAGLNSFTFYGTPPVTLGATSSRRVQLNNQPAVMDFHDIGITGVVSRYAMRENPEAQRTVESLWFNSIRRLSVYVGNSWYIFDEASGLPSSIIYSIAWDSAGWMYVGTGDQGIYRSRFSLTSSELRKQFERSGKGLYQREITTPCFEKYWNQENGAPFDDPQSLLFVGDRLWVGSASRGLVVINPQTRTLIHQMNSDAGFRSPGIINLIFSPVSGTVWCGSSNGIYEIDPISYKLLRSVFRDDGLISSEVNWLTSTAFDSDGKLYIGTPKGMTIYDPKLDRPDLTSPQPSITSATFHQSLGGENELLTEFSALSFTNEKAVQYKVRLVGYESDWHAVSEPRTRYTNLPAWFTEARYRFEVLASNAHGVWSEMPAVYEFNVMPVWWLRWWAFGIYIALFSALVLGARWFVINWRSVLMPKTRYIAHYKILEKIGRGGMGMVYKARDTLNKRTVAIKILHEEFEQTEDGIKRFIKEAEIGRKLKHPHIVEIYDAGRFDKTRYITMEFIEGVTLKNFLRVHGPLMPADVVRIIRPVAQALRTIHAHDVIHRDLKSDNVMIRNDGVVKIMDFGLARTKGMTTVVQRDQLVGTLAYMSPEQSLGKPVDARSDIYALGVIMFEMVEGCLPFNGQHEMELIYAIHNETPEFHNTNIPEALRQFILRCLEKEPERRLANMDELEEVLNKIAV